MSGYIDTYNSKECLDQVKQLFHEGTTSFVFDLSQITYISSTGIGLFVNTLKEVRKANGDIILSGMIPRVKEVFQLLGFESFFTTVDTVEEAKERLPFVSATNIPFNKMEALTSSFAEIERYVELGRQQDFYAALLRILRQIEEIKS